MNAAFEPRFPDAALKYLDADDATAWGALFARQLPAWLERFERRPETLAGYMWRGHWAHLRSG